VKPGLAHDLAKRASAIGAGNPAWVVGPELPALDDFSSSVRELYAPDNSTQSNDPV